LNVDRRHEIRGDFRREKEEYELAMADYDEALRLDPKNSGAYGGRGNVWYSRQQYDRALADYDEAIRRNPGDIQV
jgi:tetratricopeptide (TPR) repeat protein